jgi:hypothetical protein
MLRMQGYSKCSMQAARVSCGDARARRLTHVPKAAVDGALEQHVGSLQVTCTGASSTRSGSYCLTQQAPLLLADGD